MTFVEAVNRILRSNGILGADDDDVTFNDTAHKATITLARIAVQDEVNDLAAENILPNEVATGSITTVASTPTYDLPADFVRFYGNPPRLYYSAGNRDLFEYPGGMDQLSLDFTRFEVEQGEPHYWYSYPTTTKKIGFWQVPEGARTYTFRYERSVAVTDPSDALPFHTEPEAQMFCQPAGRRFRAMREEGSDVQRFLIGDSIYNSTRAALINLMKGRNAYTRYASRIL